MKHTDLKISVLMSTYNNENTVEESVNSILNQDYQNFEILIMNDGSTDRTAEILNALKDSRIKIFTNFKNLGLTKSLNILAENASGTYLARQDADDVSLRNRFSQQIKLIQEQNLDIVCSRAFIKNSKRTIPRYKNLISYKMLYKFTNPFIHGTFIIKKSTFYKVGGYNENFKYAQDYKFMHDAIKNKAKIKIVKKPLYILNTENNISSLKKNEQKFYADHVKNDTIPI